MQMNSAAGTEILRPQLDAFMRSCMANGDSWWNSGFCPPPGGGKFGAGVLNMSPGWFQQSHEVSYFKFFYVNYYLFIGFILQAIA
jgi:hypothetical protein